MVRVYIDPHMFGRDWFNEVLDSMVESGNVKFVYCASEAVLAEASKVRSALKFYKLMGSAKGKDGKPLRDDVCKNLFKKRMEIVQSVKCYESNESCDDAHIFSIVYLKNVRFVFSCDHRLGRCRDSIRQVVSKKYCRFAILSTQAVYDRHSRSILS